MSDQHNNWMKLKSATDYAMLVPLIARITGNVRSHVQRNVKARIRTVVISELARIEVISEIAKQRIEDA